MRPGKNLLAVRVINPGTQPVDGFQINEVPHSFKQSDHFVFGGNANSGGLLLPVELLIRPAVRISSLYCRPDLATGQVTLRLSVENDLPQNVACSLAVAIERQDASRSAVVCSAGAELVAVPRTSEFALLLVVPQAKPWSPQAPDLYWATARLQAESAERRNRRLVPGAVRILRFPCGIRRLFLPKRSTVVPQVVPYGKQFPRRHRHRPPARHVYP